MFDDALILKYKSASAFNLSSVSPDIHNNAKPLQSCPRSALGWAYYLTIWVVQSGVE